MKNNIYFYLLDSLIDPVLFVDTDHIIRYLNKAAKHHYSEGAALLNCSIMDCHNATSVDQILAIFSKMKAGLEEEMITDNEEQRIFMRAVRDNDNRLIGYYERYEQKTGDK
ncbi:MAG: PAS domain-containing protein [Candidatus Marinimicrobia bacterium]|nr:PAS domain-containing protein [Candidatus Neomarinimicrobiota bacterium]